MCIGWLASSGRPTATGVVTQKNAQQHHITATTRREGRDVATELLVNGSLNTWALNYLN
jgi:hypothetical protein